MHTPTTSAPCTASFRIGRKRLAEMLASVFPHAVLMEMRIEPAGLYLVGLDRTTTAAAYEPHNPATYPGDVPGNTGTGQSLPCVDVRLSSSDAHAMKEFCDSPGSTGGSGGYGNVFDPLGELDWLACALPQNEPAADDEVTITITPDRIGDTGDGEQSEDDRAGRAVVTLTDGKHTWRTDARAKSAGWQKLLRRLLAAPKRTGDLPVNPLLLARFCTVGEPLHVRVVDDPSGMAMLLLVGDRFIGAVAPRRSEDPDRPADTWTTRLATPTRN